MKLPETCGPLDDAQKLLRAEVQRAISLFPKDECEAICEVIRRSNTIPDLKRVLLIHAAFMAVSEELDTGRWYSRRE